MLLIYIQLVHNICIIFTVTIILFRRLIHYFFKYHFHHDNIHNDFVILFSFRTTNYFQFFRCSRIRTKTSLCPSAIFRFERIFSWVLGMVPLNTARCRTPIRLAFCLYYKITLRVVFSSGLPFFICISIFSILP